MNDEAHAQSSKDSFLDVLRQVSLAQAKQYVESDDVELILAPPDHVLGQVLKRYIVMILLTGTDIRMTFKVHFNPEQVRVFRFATGAKPEDLTDKHVIDYMKELGNQIGGRACRIFQANGISLGMSIPLCTRGIFEIYADYQAKTGLVTKFGDFWGLNGSFGLLYFSCYVELMNAERFKNIVYSDEHSDEGELDFL